MSLDDVVHCYRLFIRSLLEITDNRRDGVVSHPPRSVTYDNQDPYFVVAADKGTAAFSDIANEIAEKEFDLWIGDAFASGGSQGYSHKKFGITARGAWEAALVHFRELGLDPEREPFTVVGIGDMSGDVFGNGLIISKHAKLLGAFDHRQIFVDPNPDCAISFEERKRLFELPRSSWSDYNKALISQGGGVFPRDSKSIPVTPEMRVALGIAATIESLTGQELIQAILRAPVDLLWNGGIGTYVKAPFEDHSHAADRANDDVRIDATELRARAVAEGGNLGFTQLGRTSYAEEGGHINTDAIDNSGGVDLSDHEVNLKILLSAPVRRGELTVEERTKLLLECVDEVCESVIARNRAQSTAISLIVEKSSSRLTYHGGYIRKLHREGAIDRRSDGLPDDETLARRATEGKGLYRPEAALLLAYAKMRAYNIMLRSSIADDPYLDGLLFRYFPSRIADKFSRDIAQHPLRAEIICTQVANILFERLDPTFLFRLSEELGVSKERVIRAFLAAYEFLRCAPLVAALERSEHPGNVRVVRVAYHRIASTLFRATRWLLQHHDTEKNIGAVVDYFAPGFQTLQAHVRETLSPADRQRHDTIYQRFVSGEISPEVAAHLTSFVFVVPLMEVIDIAEVENRGLLDVAKLYAYLSSELEIGKLLTKVEQPDLTDPQDVTAWRELFSQMRDVTGGILRAVVVERESVTVDAGAAFLADRVDAVARVRAITKEYDKRPLSLGALYTLCQRFEALQRPKQP
ncbi:MAG: NAD-glutamate dehydrogenase [Deltaproteobacteria bacterium]|nr:NAD-glutamate dehydrogenase [Deltaproteobacteria bacterium]